MFEQENTKSPNKKFVSPKSVTRKIKSGMIPKKSVFTDITERNLKERGIVEVETMSLAQQALNLQKKTTGIYYILILIYFYIFY